MKWMKNFEDHIPIKSWCKDIEDGALKQAVDLAAHPVIKGHVALMPDCHEGYGMPIGGVIACENAVIPNAVGVDIGCGMVAVESDCKAEALSDMRERRKILDYLKKLVPVGEGTSHKSEQDWDGFDKYLSSLGGENLHDWPSKLDRKNLGTLGGGNHFIELQESEDGKLWLMIHSGSRNLGYRVASYYNAQAQKLNSQMNLKIPSKDLAFLPVDHELGVAYIRDMNFALDYALENRRRMMQAFKDSVAEFLPGISFVREVNIHHNYAASEVHGGKEFWIHRKGATSAKTGETGIIPGSMGTASYIVEGLGNPESFMSCSHGAGRRMGRGEASRTLSVEACDKAMEGIAFDRWSKFRSKWKKKGEKALFDLSEAPLAYKDIDEVIESERDLVKVLVKLRPLGVVKG